MKIKVTKNGILKALTYCISILGGKNLVPILDNVLIKAKDGTMVFRTSTLNTEITYSIKINDTGEFEALLPCQLLFNALKSVREDEITLQATEKQAGGSTVLIKTKKGRSKIEGFATKDFPKQKVTELPQDFITFKSVRGIEDIKYAMNFIKVEDLRPYLSCMSLVLEGDKLTTIGMCNIAGARQYLDVHNPSNLSYTININKDVLNNALKTSLGTGVKLMVTDRVFIIESDGYMFTGDLYTEVSYPPVEKFYSPNDDNYVLINPKEILDSLTRVSNFSELIDGNNKLVKFDIIDNFSKVIVSSENYAGEAEEENNILGDNIKFVKREDKVINSKLNSLYLSKILESTDKTLKLFVKESATPEGMYNAAFIFHLEGFSSEEELIYEKQFIIMPSI